MENNKRVLRRVNDKISSRLQFLREGKLDRRCPKEKLFTARHYRRKDTWMDLQVVVEEEEECNCETNRGEGKGKVKI